MSSEGEIWREHRKTMKEKRKVSAHQALLKLQKAGIKFQAMKGDGHYRVGEYDFWPSSEKFYSQKTKIRGRWVENLIKIYEQKT